VFERPRGAPIDEPKKTENSTLIFGDEDLIVTDELSRERQVVPPQLDPPSWIAPEAL
jgi:hypothetical protein